MNGVRVVWLLIPMLAGHAQAADLAPEFWDRPRSAQAVISQPAIRQAVTVLQSRSDARLLIVHGTRQEAQLQAEELRAWLVALAVDGARLQLRSDPAAVMLRLEIAD